MTPKQMRKLAYQYENYLKKGAEKILLEKNIRLARVFNVDESSVSTTTEVSRVLARKGRKIGGLTSQDGALV